MGAVKLGFVATFLSDPLISGFTTGSAVLVVVSQLKHILGLKIPQITGPLSSVKVWTRHEFKIQRSAIYTTGDFCHATQYFSVTKLRGKIACVTGPLVTLAT